MLLRRPYIATIYFLTFQEFVQYIHEVAWAYRGTTIRFSTVVRNFHDFRLICMGKSIKFEQKFDIWLWNYITL